MDDLVTFNTTDGRMRLTVKKEFSTVVDLNKDELDFYLLTKEKNLGHYLHNPKGPAIVFLNPIKNSKQELLDMNEYWLNGRKLSREEGKKMEHDAKFSEKFNAMLEEGV